MAESGKEQKNVFKQIFEDGWDDFKHKYPRYEAVDEVVQKMLGCGNPENGHAVYLCPECLEEHVVGFSCKSTFCLSCAKVYGQEWVETVKGMLHPGVRYRHLILTVPEGLRTLIYQYPGELLDGMLQAARGAMDAAVGQAKRQAVELGYIVVLQTAGRAANYNPHLHVLMTDGGLTEEGEWQTLGYVPYDLLHREWQSHVLKMVEERLAGNAKAAAVVAEMRAKYPKGFVAHLKGDIVPRVSELARYIVKYVVSPPMGLSRIIKYDRVRGEVTYWYKDHLSHGKKTTVTVDRETFIGPLRVVQHILPKGFQRIRPKVWAASDVQVEEGAGAVGGSVARGSAVGDGGGGQAHEAVDVSGADETDIGARPAEVPAVWSRDVVVESVASEVQGDLRYG